MKQVFYYMYEAAHSEMLMLSHSTGLESPNKSYTIVSGRTPTYISDLKCCEYTISKIRHYLDRAGKYIKHSETAGKLRQRLLISTLDRTLKTVSPQTDKN